MALALAGAGSASAAFPGANGKIAYSIDPTAPGSYEIVAIDPDGQNRVQITTRSFSDYDPSYSPDGERLAFASAPPATTPGQIWTMNADGGDQLQLTSGASNALDLSPEFSPDGRSIVFDRYNGMTNTQVWAMSDDGSGQAPVTTGASSSRQPSFSPDGSKIVFSRSDASQSGIWVMNSDGSGQQRLTTTAPPAFDGSPSFSPDGHLIVFNRYNGSQDDIWVMNADGSGQTPLTTGPQLEANPTFSPDGSQVAFFRSGAGDNLFVMSASGGDPTPVPGTADVYGESQITWQPLNPPACDLSGEAKQKSFRQIDVTVTCSNENAAATLSGTGEAKKVPKLATASRKKRFEIPAVSTQLAAETPTPISLPIPKKGRKALKRAAKAGKKGTATVTAVLTDDFGQTSQDTLSVTFKKKRKK